MFLEKGILKLCSKFVGEHPYPSAISIKLERNFMEIAFRHGCSPVNLLHIFRTPFLKNTSGRLLLNTIIGEVENKTPDYIKYVTSQEFKKLTSKDFTARLKQANLACKK